MSKLAWAKTNQKLRPSRSIADEKEFRSRDAAARWLKKLETRKAKKRRETAQ